MRVVVRVLRRAHRFVGDAGDLSVAALHELDLAPARGEKLLRARLERNLTGHEA